MKLIYLFIAFSILSLLGESALAQANRKVSGMVIDSTKTAIADANVILIVDKDTLITSTNSEGFFSFSKLKTDQFSITISAIGYQSFSATHNFNKQKSLDLPAIVLKLGGQMLKEVVIKGKPNPMRIMQDTVEYDANAFQVLDGDNVADLLKQFAGVEVDGDYNVKTQGEEMTKLRVNGKDFFTNNVKDFISKLPAQIVAKIQIIDDFGDEANFTGLKIGEPKKMLNIVTKPGMNKGRFGMATIGGGTSDKLNATSMINLWNDSKQSGGNLGFNTQDNGAGKIQNTNVSINHRDNFGKFGTLSVNYMLYASDNAFSNEQAVETVSDLGTFYNQAKHAGDNKNSNNNLGLNYNYNNKKVYISAYTSASINKSTNSNISLNKQSGFLRQDLNNTNNATNQSPNINANINLSKRLKKNGFSVNFGFSSSKNESLQNINTNTLYYNKSTNVLQKDSVLNRMIDNNNVSNAVNFGINYSLTLKKPKDTLANRSLNFNYNAAFTNSSASSLTSVYNNQNAAPTYVDSLSNIFKSTSLNQSLGLNYNYTDKKIRLNVGFNLRPTLLSNNYINLSKKVQNNNLNYAPNLNFSKTIAKNKTFSTNYTGNNMSPNLMQLQPIKNTQNLQNIVIGNPKLKPSFSHRLSSNYNYIHVKSGASSQIGLNISTTQNEIVNNIVFIPDTLNSIKQETRFENTNGTYNLSSNYNISLPFKKNKYSINYGGNLGFSNKAVFINNEKKFNEGVNFSQNIRAAIRLKMFTLNTSISYNLTTNNNTLIQNNFDNSYFNLGQFSGTAFYRTQSYRADASSTFRLKKFNFTTNINYNQSYNTSTAVQENFKKISTVSIQTTASATLLKSYHIGLNGAKVFNSGYSLANTNPLIINANFSKAFLKDKALTLNINANDLLNQGNNLSRSIVGNSVIDSRTNQVTRIISFGLMYNLSKFGGAGKTYRVDVDDAY